MRASKALAKLLVVAGPVAMLLGCDLSTGVKEPTTTSDWESSIDLESPTGGFTMSGEATAFGDPTVLAVELLEGDPQPTVADVDTMPVDSLYAIRVVWGQLEGNPDAQSVIDWTGAVSVDRGHLGLMRTIAFEFPTDHLVRPRPNPQTVEFVSFTKPHFDGLQLVLHEAPGDGPTTFSFRTGPYSNTWTVDELLGTNLVIPVDDEGNAVSINAMRWHRLECPAGFARGAWAAREGARGVLRGVWMTPLGDPAGYIRGHFGVNRAGEHVWFAKVIGRDGRAFGLIQGRWEPSDDPTLHGGQFAGRLQTRAGDGEVMGRYMRAREGDPETAGFFQLRWRLVNCERPDMGPGPGDGGSGEDGNGNPTPGDCDPGTPSQDGSGRP